MKRLALQIAFACLIWLVVYFAVVLSADRFVYKP